MLHKLLRCHKTVSFARQKKQEWIQHMLTDYFKQTSFNKNKTHKHMTCWVLRAARSAFRRRENFFRPPPSAATADWLKIFMQQRFTLRCATTLAWSERLHLYNPQIMTQPRKTKEMDYSRAKAPFGIDGTW